MGEYFGCDVYVGCEERVEEEFYESESCYICNDVWNELEEQLQN